MSIFENNYVIAATYIIHKIFSTIFYVACAIFFVWFGWSLIEVWLHNATMLDANPYEYSNINLFQLLMG